jgi:hypothetical protein
MSNEPIAIPTHHARTCFFRMWARNFNGWRTIDDFHLQLGNVPAEHKSISGTRRSVNLMQTALLCADGSAIVATEIFEMERDEVKLRAAQ